MNNVIAAESVFSEDGGNTGGIAAFFIGFLKVLGAILVVAALVVGVFYLRRLYQAEKQKREHRRNSRNRRRSR